ncbi:endonuclease domain-containing protein [Rufibacter psychrotolerans]|uniref:endonuclease domain-containing protein n=1 Tax=Rufibacter psychrotolerans TaxID=2812556 RepID=UPI0019683934|nr:endonuclease domain-containing protein [Rufibacter sp. SYSU D00308]
MRRTIIPYKPYLKELARKLRQNSTLAEILLWNELRNKQLLRLDFDRQKPLDRFIVDFYCKDLQLAIEIDGESHDYSFAEDELRQQRLERLGVRFLRFSDEEVKQDMANVLRTIEIWVEENGLQ